MSASTHLTSAEVTQLRTELLILRNEVQTLTNVTRVQEPKFPLPDKFNGTQSQYRDFKAAVQQFINLKKKSYSTDELKTGLVGSLLKDNALTWYRRLLETKDPLLGQADQFWIRMDTMFGNPFIQSTAQRQLNKLRQTGAALIYASDFLRISVDAGHNDVTLQALFKRGLKEEVQNAISIHNETYLTVQDLIDYSITIDNHFHEQRLQRLEYRTIQPQLQHRRATPMGRPTINTTFTPRSSTPRSPTYTPRAISSSSGPQPMDLSAVTYGKLTPEIKQYRFQNQLCLYCGTAGHRAIECPKKKTQNVSAIAAPKPTTYQDQIDQPYKDQTEPLPGNGSVRFL